MNCIKKTENNEKNRKIKWPQMVQQISRTKCLRMSNIGKDQNGRVDDTFEGR